MKVLFFLCSFVISIMAADALEVADNLGFYNDYDTALATAKKSDRILVLIVLKDPCPYCDRLANNTLSDTNVEKALKDFVPVVVDINDDYPKGFRPAMTPVTMFVNPQTEDLLWESMGAVNAKTFQSDLKEATLSRQEDEAAH